MIKGMITECVYFDSIEGLSDEEFTGIVEKLERDFHMRQPGIIDTELVRGKSPRQWLMIQHWESLDHATAASRKLMTDETTEMFRRSLDPKTVRISYHEHVARWEK